MGTPISFILLEELFEEFEFEEGSVGEVEGEDDVRDDVVDDDDEELDEELDKELDEELDEELEVEGDLVDDVVEDGELVDDGGGLVVVCMTGVKVGLNV